MTIRIFCDGCGGLIPRTGDALCVADQHFCEFGGCAGRVREVVGPVVAAMQAEHRRSKVMDRARNMALELRPGRRT